MGALARAYGQTWSLSHRLAFTGTVLGRAGFWPMAILEVDTASHSKLLFAAEGENILYFTIEMIPVTFLPLKLSGSVSELIWA